MSVHSIPEAPASLADGVKQHWSELPTVRFAATLLANLLRTAISFVTGLVVARGLGATAYGDAMFLLGSFVAVNAILDAGSLSAFYTMLSGRRRGVRFFGLYFSWTLAVQFAGTILLIAAIFPQRVLNAIWLGHDRGVVVLAFAASFMVNHVWNAVSRMGEAARQTIIVQSGATVQALVHFALIVLAVRGQWLTVPAVLVLLLFEHLVLSLVLAPRLLAANLDREADPRLGPVIREFLAYCKPLVLYALISFVYQFADRWLLQKYGGPVQQGYFSVGQQFANISLLATTSILSVFWKEIAAAQAAADAERVRRIYASVKNALFFVAAWVSCLLIPYSRDIVLLTLGREYEHAWPVLALLFFYPIHQSVGQIQATLCLATGRTDRYSLMGILFMLISIPASYFVLAAPTAPVPGFGLAAAGLAAKMVILQVIGIVFQTFLLHASHGIGFDFGYQASVIGVLLGIAAAARMGAGSIVSAIDSPIVTALVGGTFYAVASAILVLRFPSLAGLTKTHIASAFHRLGPLFARSR